MAKKTINELGHKYINRAHIPHMAIVDVRDPQGDPIYNFKGEPSMRVKLFAPDPESRTGWIYHRNTILIMPVYRNTLGRRFIHCSVNNCRYFLDDFEVIKKK